MPGDDYPKMTVVICGECGATLGFSPALTTAEVILSHRRWGRCRVEPVPGDRVLRE